MKNARLLLGSPALTVGGVTVVLFAVARVPTQIFYSQFGIRPEDVGLDSVQVLLQGTAMVLIASLLVGLFYGLLTMIFVLGYADLLIPTLKSLRTKGLGGRARPEGQSHWDFFMTSLRRSARRSLRAAPIIVPALSIATAFAILIGAAIEEAGAVKGGQPPGNRFMPWKVELVEVTWTDTTRRIPLPGCESLFYLGEGNERVALYDSDTDRTYRINSDEIQLDFPSDCTEHQGRAKSAS
jgi:hypothetical protein